MPATLNVWRTLKGKPAYYPDLTVGNTLAAATANTAAINAAILAVNALGGGTVIIPDGAWYILLSLATTYIRARSNVTFRGQSWESHLWVYAGSGNYQAVFWDAGSTLTNFTLRDLSIHQNPAANTTADIQTQTQGAPNNNQCLFGLYVTGANAKNIRIIETNWEDCCGVNTLNVNSTGGSRVRVFGNRLSFKRGHTTGVMPSSVPFWGITGYDSSVGYFAARDVRGSDNTVVVDDYADFNGGIEIHGVEQAWQHNTFHGCYTAFSIVPPFTAGDNQDPANVRVSSNHINRAAVAIGMQLPSSSVGAKGWAVNDNQITLYQAGGHHDSTESAGIRLTDNGLGGGTLDGLEIVGNRIEFEPDARASSTRYSHALAITQDGIALNQRSPLRNAKVKGNSVVRAPAAGISMGFYASDAELTGVDCTGNETIDCGANANNSAVNTNNGRCHISVTGKCSDVKVYDNLLKDTGAPTNLIGQYGMRLGPHVSGGSPLYCYAHNNRIQTTVLPMLPYIFDFGYTLLAQNLGTISNGASIPHFQCPTIRFQLGGNITGALLTAGVYHGQRVTLINESAFTVTFAATGTYGVGGASNVAGGTSETIPANCCRTYVWNQAGGVNQWFAER